MADPSIHDGSCEPAALVDRYLTALREDYAYRAQLLEACGDDQIAQDKVWRDIAWFREPQADANYDLFEQILGGSAEVALEVLRLLALGVADDEELGMVAGLHFWTFISERQSDIPQLEALARDCPEVRWAVELAYQQHGP